MDYDFICIDEKLQRRRVEESPLKNFISFLKRKNGKVVVEEIKEVSEEKYEELKESVV